MMRILDVPPTAIENTGHDLAIDQPPAIRRKTKAMPKQTVNFRDDIPLIRKYLAARARSQSKAAERISAIEIGYQLNQAGLIVAHFDTRPKHQRDGSWTMAMEGPVLKVPKWRRVYEASERHGASFVLPDGTSQKIAAGASDAAVAAIFGKVLLALVKDALARGLFESLKLRKNCQLDIEEFDNMWAWPTKYENLGRTNIIAKMKPARLPE